MGCNAVIVMARLHSSRLPRKAIIEICGKRAIEYVFERAKAVKNADKVILITSNLGEDVILHNLAKNYNIDFVIGDSNNKMQGMVAAVHKYKIDAFCTADGDDLFCSSELMDLAFEKLNNEQLDFIEGCKDFPIGAFTYCINASALSKLYDLVDTEFTQMMFEFFKARRDLFKLGVLELPNDDYKFPDLRCTLDYFDDMRFFIKIIEQMKNNFTIKDVVSLVREYPELKLINDYLNIEWRANQIKQTNLIFKDVQHE